MKKDRRLNHAQAGRGHVTGGDDAAGGGAHNPTPPAAAREVKARGFLEQSAAILDVIAATPVALSPGDAARASGTPLPSPPPQGGREQENASAERSSEAQP